MIGHQHMTLYWTYVQWALKLASAPRPMKLVDPELLVSWYAGTTESEEPAELVQQWRCILDMCIQDATAVVLFPVWKSEHWTLLVVDQGERRCRYYDSLQAESEGSYLVADYVVTSLAKAGHASLEWLPAVCPHRVNSCKQGSLECGFFVCWWLEEECRAMMGEGWCSRGWPQPMEVRRCMERFLHNLQATAERMARDRDFLEKVEEEAVKAHDEAAAAAKAAGAVGDLAKSLQEKAIADLLQGEHVVPVVVEPVGDDLRVGRNKCRCFCFRHIRQM
jgi:hypothetical protein